MKEASSLTKHYIEKALCAWCISGNSACALLVGIERRSCARAAVRIA